EPTSRYLPNIDSHRPHRTGATASVPRAMKVADSLTASKSKSAPDRPTIRLASDVTPAAIVTTAVARRCGTSSFCAIIPLLLGPHAAKLLDRLGWLGSHSFVTPQREPLTGPQLSAILCSRISNKVPIA